MCTFAMIKKAKENMVADVIGFMGENFEDFKNIKKDYDEALVALQHEVGYDKIEHLKNAVDECTMVQIIFCESLGFKTNLEIFRNPEKSNFYEQDFEVYLGLTDMESILQYRCERKVIDDFLHSLTTAQKVFFDTIQEYLIYLDCTVPKLAHYMGYMLGDSLLEFIEPGYTSNNVIAKGYKGFLEDWFGIKVETVTE